MAVFVVFYFLREFAGVSEEATLLCSLSVVWSTPPAYPLTTFDCGDMLMQYIKRAAGRWLFEFCTSVWQRRSWLAVTVVVNSFCFLSCLYFLYPHTTSFFTPPSTISHILQKSAHYSHIVLLPSLSSSAPFIWLSLLLLLSWLFLPPFISSFSSFSLGCVACFTFVSLLGLQLMPCFSLPLFSHLLVLLHTFPNCVFFFFVQLTLLLLSRCCL